MVVPDFVTGSGAVPEDVGRLVAVGGVVQDRVVGRVSSRGGLGGDDDDAAMGNRRSGSNDAADLVVQHQGVVDTSQGDADPGGRQTGTARAGHVVGPDLVVRDAVVAGRRSPGVPLPEFRARIPTQLPHDLLSVAVRCVLSRMKIPNPLWSLRLSRATLYPLGESPMYRPASVFHDVQLLLNTDPVDWNRAMP